MTYTTSKALSAKITSVVPTTTTVGIISGKITRRKIVSSPAPSTRAASRRSAGMPLRAADRMTMAKPVMPQTAAAMIAKLLILGSWIQILGSVWKSVVTMALAVPVWIAPGGWYQYMNFQITPRATEEMAIGM